VALTVRSARAPAGDITLAGNPASDWKVRTGSGKILVDLPSTASFALDAVTGSGSIDVAHPLQALSEQPQRRLQATVGNGGPVSSSSRHPAESASADPRAPNPVRSFPKITR
jgi:hypothetical protein